MKIYLAGKISRKCWRHGIVEGLQGAAGDDQWPVLRNSIFGLHDYVGPYFGYQGHGLQHGDNSHGVLYTSRVNTKAESSLISKCLRAIESCDLMFCWIDATDAFGTISEIGFAKALGKTIFWASPFDDVYAGHGDHGVIDEFTSALRDLWFPLKMGVRVGDHDATPASALRQLLKIPDESQVLDWKDYEADSPEKYARYLASREWGLLKQAVHRRAGGKCERCRRNKINAVHHLTYIRKYCERLEDLQAICNACHDFEHGRSNYDPRQAS
jgi:hypothetical protein